MRKLSRAIVPIALIGAAQSAAAADLSAAPVYKAPPPAVSDWSGLYIGGDVGLRTTRTDITTDSALFLPAFTIAGPLTANSQPMDATAFRLGGYAGYNWQVAPAWVVGVEGDVGWANKTVTLNGVFLPGGFFAMPGETTASLSTRTTWDASARGRVGYLVTPGTMLYATAGAAWLRFDSTATCGILTCFTPVTFSNASTRLGWTVGGGIEARLWGHWLGRAEYRYADFGTVTYANSNAAAGLVATYDERVRTHTALFGLAYKFGPDTGIAPASVMPTKAPPAVRRGWSGAYAGLDLGFRATMTDATENGVTVNGVAAGCVFGVLIPPLSCVASEPMNGSAFRIGGHLGYDWQFAPLWVAGLEGDLGSANRTVPFSGSPLPGNINGFLVPVGGFSGLAGDMFSVRTTWDGGVRGRVGVLATPSLLVYATGGPAWLRVESTSTCGLSPAGGCFATMMPLSITNASTRSGFTVGGGAEARLWGDWFGRAEYRYADYGTATYVNTVLNTGFPGFGPFLYKDTYSLRIQTHTVSFGLSYKFWDGPRS